MANDARLPKPIVSYCRVSTKQQGASGLGLEAQRQAVHAYVERTGATILSEHVEVESGRKSDRKELHNAIGQAMRGGGQLVVAKLDRLSRNVAFLSALMESNVDFVCCDNPSANKLTIHILVAVAQDEAEKTSLRTKEGLKVAKQMGKLLGSSRPGHWKGRENKRKEGLLKAKVAAKIKRQEEARKRIADLIPVIRELRLRGGTYDEIADALNAAGQVSPMGKKWSSMTVHRICKRENIRIPSGPYKPGGVSLRGLLEI